MRRLNGLVIALALLVPVGASAQKKPGNNMHTRSAVNYLEQARKEVVEADKLKLYRQALEVTQNGAKSDGDNANVWLLMGQAYIGLGQTAAADSAFDRAEQLWPEFAEQTNAHRQNAWVLAFNRGVAHLNANETDQALAAFQEADAIFRGRPEALIMLAQIRLRANDVAAAEQDLRNAIAVLQGPLPTGIKPEDEQRWRQDEEETVLQLGEVLVQAERFDDAAAVYRTFLARRPEHVIAKANLGVALTRAGKAAEAAPIFTQLLEQPDVDAATLFNVGVGLFRAEQYEPAIKAFERAAQLNKFGHATLYNLAQSYYAHAAALEQAKAGKSAAEQAPVNTQLLSLYTRMAATAEQLLALDPANANVHMMIAHSQRARGELTRDAAKAEEWKRAVLATLERHEAMPFTVSEVQITTTRGKTMVNGQILNLKAAEGSPLTIEFMLLDDQGNTVAQQAITATAPVKGEATRFNVEIPSPDTVTAWKYVVK